MLAYRMTPPGIQWQPVLEELVIPALQDMERSGRYDRDVLIWIQEGYVDSAAQASAAVLLDRIGDVDDGLVQTAADGLRDRLTTFAIEAYAEAKRAGAGIDLSGYAKSAADFYEHAGLAAAMGIDAIADQVNGIVAAAGVPDGEWISRGAYLAITRASRAIQELDELGEENAQQRVSSAVDQAVRRLAGAGGSDGRKRTLGQKVLQAVLRIGDSPDQYLQVENSGGADIVADPWDFEPDHREDFDLM